MKIRSIITKLTAVFALALMLSACTTIIPGTGETSTVTNGPQTPTKTDNATTVDVPPETDTTDVNREQRASFISVGDVIIHDAVREDAAKRAGGVGFNFLPMYADVASTVQQADVAFVNMESPVAGASFGYSGYPYFNAPNEAAEALIDIGFDVFNINNNHMLDQATAGLDSTMKYFMSKNGILTIGAYYGNDLYKPQTVTVNGIKIGFVSLNYGSNITTNDPKYGITIPYYKQNGVIDSDFVRGYVSNAAKNCDFLIASVHWGDEGTFAVNSEQRELAALISESGADAIIGHHSHVIQPVEWHVNSDSSKTLVAYSLGNYISTQHPDYNMVGGMMQFDIVRDESGACRIESPLFIPTMTHYSMTRDQLQVFLLENYTEALAKTHGTSIRPESQGFSYAKMLGYVKATISEEFLSDFYKN